MGPIGFPELVIIFIVALIVFGPRKLPELGKSLGKGLAEFKRASNDFQNTLAEEVKNEERKTAIMAPTAASGEISAAASTPAPIVAETVPHGQQHGA